MEQLSCYAIPEGVQEHKTKTRNTSLQSERVNIHKHIPIVIQRYVFVLRFVTIFCCCMIWQSCISTEIPATLEIFSLKGKKNI